MLFWQMNNRRKLVIALGAGAVTPPLASFAQQQGKVWRIGFFYLGSRQSAMDTGRYQLFVKGMGELGYLEGKNVVIEARFADGNPDKLIQTATELVRQKVDVIVATGTAVYHALLRATRTVPIVITTSGDPVGEGLAVSLARPEGNVTGLSSLNNDVTPKYVELISALVPKLARIAVLSNPAHSGHPARIKAVQATAQRMGLQVLSVDGGTPEDIKRAFATMARKRVGAVIVLPDTFFLQQQRQITELALAQRIPSMFFAWEFTESGGLMSYGQNVTDNFRRAATYVDKILKGAKPGELPIEQPTKFDLVINGKTAKALGLTVPQSLLISADKVIE